MRTKSLPKHLRIVLLYAFVAVLWLLIPDYLIGRLNLNSHLLLKLETYKSVAFIAVTAVLLYFERKSSDSSQKKTEEKYRIIAEFTHDWEYWLNVDGQFEYISPSCKPISGYDTSEFLKDPELLKKIVHPDDREAFAAHAETEKTEESPSSIEFRIIKKNGEICWLGHVCRRVFDNNHNYLGIRAGNRDITQRKKYQEEEKSRMEELAHADKMITLGTLVSGVAHEINNPTNFISLNTPLVREAWHGSQSILDEHFQQNGDFVIGRFTYSTLRDRIDRLLDGISEGAKRIQRIVANLKDYARPDPSEMNQSVDINEILQSAAALLKSSIDKRTNNFEIQYGSSIPCIHGSKQKMEQVIINLIQNAIESLPDKEKAVTVCSSFRPDTNRVVIEVKDNGTGMSDEERNRILDPFFTTKRAMGGTGLGLPIADKIVQDHHGSLSFTSSLGSGTVATLSFPAMDTSRM